MANYYAAARSNYFKIGRPKEFMEWIKDMPDVVFEPREKQSDPQDLVGMVYVDNPDGAGWPSWRYDEETGDEEEIDFFYDLAQFLAPGEVAVFMETGAEKLRYLCGYACAVNDKGEYLEVNINDIYTKVSDEWGIDDISTAEY